MKREARARLKIGQRQLGAPRAKTVASSSSRFSQRPDDSACVRRRFFKVKMRLALVGSAVQNWEIRAPSQMRVALVRHHRDSATLHRHTNL